MKLIFVYRSNNDKVIAIVQNGIIPVGGKFTYVVLKSKRYVVSSVIINYDNNSATIEVYDY